MACKYANGETYLLAAVRGALEPKDQMDEELAVKVIEWTRRRGLRIGERHFNMVEMYQGGSSSLYEYLYQHRAFN